jgi:subtilase family serine protease
MAPKAKIVLVEAASNSNVDLYAAVDVATQKVLASGSGEVSMSWGGSEYSGEAANDSHFKHSGVVYFASSGDTGGVTEYPSASPFVVAAGGTTLNRNTDKSFKSETGWSGSGGGPSKYEPKPSWQTVLGTSATARSIPDFSFVGDPNTGVSVYDSTRCQGLLGWLVFGGTSVSAPSLAGIVNTAGHFYPDSTTELSTMYSNILYSTDGTNNNFYDVLTGTAGGNTAKAGYDYITGIGSSRGTTGK